MQHCCYNNIILLNTQWPLSMELYANDASGVACTFHVIMYTTQCDKILYSCWEERLRLVAHATETLLPRMYTHRNFDYSHPISNTKPLIRDPNHWAEGISIKIIFQLHYVFTRGSPIQQREHNHFNQQLFILWLCYFPFYFWALFLCFDYSKDLFR